METTAVLTPAQKIFNERLQRVNDAIALNEPDKIPFAPYFDGVIQRLYGSSYRNIFYDFKTATDAFVKFYQDYPLCDAHFGCFFFSGKANEVAGTTMIDWPGRPGSIVNIHSTHQVIEHEYLLPEEYHEFLNDFTGFMIRKYIPRAFTNLKAMGDLNFTSTIFFCTAAVLPPLYSPAMLEAYKTIAEIGKHDAEAAAATNELMERTAAIGMPPFLTGMSLAPFDILSGSFRGTVGLMQDMFEYEDEIIKACDMIADQQIASLQYFRFVPMPARRVFFPMHKGMDGFMSKSQYEKLYWNPLKKIITALIDMDVTPILWTEGKYNTRLQQLTDVPKGKVIIHFEDVDMKEAKRILGGTACISGNLSASMLEFGKKDDVVNYCKYLIDTCAPGGGYIFDVNACLENAKQENFDAMFKTFETYK